MRRRPISLKMILFVGSRPFNLSHIGSHIAIYMHVDIKLGVDENGTKMSATFTMFSMSTLVNEARLAIFLFKQIQIISADRIQTQNLWH